MKLVFNVKDVDESILLKMPSKEEMAAYKAALQKCKEDLKSDIITPEPTPPELKKYKPLEAVSLVFISAIEETYPMTQTKNIRNIIRVIDSITSQAKVNEESLELELQDIVFLQKCLAKATWKTSNVSFLKFIVGIENVILQAINSTKGTSSKQNS